LLCKEKFEDTKGLIRSRNSTDRQYNGQMKTMICKTLHRKRKT